MQHASTILILALLILLAQAYGNQTRHNSTSWDSASQNYKNSPTNPKNNPASNGSNVIFDDNGNAIGYSTRSSDGGHNYYDSHGRYQGYSDDDEEEGED